MKKLKLKLKLKISVLLKIIYPLLIITMLATSVVLFYFLYKDFYQSITQTQEVYVLRAQIAPDAVDMEIYNEVMNNIKQKTSQDISLDLENIKNPFIIPLGEPAPPTLE